MALLEKLGVSGETSQVSRSDRSRSHLSTGIPEEVCYEQWPRATEDCTILSHTHTHTHTHTLPKEAEDLEEFTGAGLATV